MKLTDLLSALSFGRTPRAIVGHRAVREHGEPTVIGAVQLSTDDLIADRDSVGPQAVNPHYRKS